MNNVGNPLPHHSSASGKLFPFAPVKSTMVRTARQPTFRIDVPSSSSAPSSAPSAPSASSALPAQRSSNLQTQMQTRLTELEQQLPTLRRTAVASTGGNGSTNGAPESSAAGQTQAGQTQEAQSQAGPTQAAQTQAEQIQAVERLARCVRSLAGVMLALLREVDEEGKGTEAELVPREAWVSWRERCRRALVEGQGIAEVEAEVEADVQ